MYPKSAAYAGWIPTITGRLSFSLIGAGGQAPGCVSANSTCAAALANGTRTRRYVVVSQRRKISDLPINGIISSRLAPGSCFDALFVGRTDRAATPVLDGDRVISEMNDMGMVRGIALFIPHHEDRFREKQARRLAASIRQEIAIYTKGTVRGAVGDPRVLEQTVLSKIRSARIDGVGVIVARVRIYRTGEVRINLSDIPKIKQDGVHYSSVASQIYFFLKYISHSHYHHNPRTDNILPLVNASNGDDISWRRETLWALVRSVLETRRRKSLIGAKKALGVLAYAEAFQSLLGKIERKPSLGGGFAFWKAQDHYDFRHTRASLEVVISEREFIDTSHNSFTNYVAAVVVGVLAFWIAIIQIETPFCRMVHETDACVAPPPLIVKCLLQLIAHPARALLLVLLGLAPWFGSRLMNANGSIRLVVAKAAGWCAAVGASIGRHLRPTLAGAADFWGGVFASVLLIIIASRASFTIGLLTGLWSLGGFLTLAGRIIWPIVDH